MAVTFLVLQLGPLLDVLFSRGHTQQPLHDQQHPVIFYGHLIQDLRRLLSKVVYLTESCQTDSEVAFFSSPRAPSEQGDILTKSS